MSFDRFNGKWQNPQCLKKKSGKSKKPQNVCLKHNEFSTVVTWISSEYGMKIKQTKNYEKSERWKKNPETNNMMKSFFTVHNVTWREILHCLFYDL